MSLTTPHASICLWCNSLGIWCSMATRECAIGHRQWRVPRKQDLAAGPIPACFLRGIFLLVATVRLRLHGCHAVFDRVHPILIWRIVLWFARTLLPNGSMTRRLSCLAPIRECYCKFTNTKNCQPLNVASTL